MLKLKWLNPFHFKSVGAAGSDFAEAFTLAMAFLIAILLAATFVTFKLDWMLARLLVIFTLVMYAANLRAYFHKDVGGR